MFGKSALPPIRSLLAAGCMFRGELCFREGLRVDGAVVGDVRAERGMPTLLVVSESGSIVGEVVADHVIVNGRIHGPVHARDQLELQPHAHVEGDVAYGRLTAYPGAVIVGQMRPLPGGAEKPLLSLPASPPQVLESPGLPR